MLERLGAEVLIAPTVQIRTIPDPGPLDLAIDRLGDYQWLAFTSANGVRFFLDRLLTRGRDVRALGHLRLAAIGPGTAGALSAFHLHADLIPQSFRSESLAEDLADWAAGQRILLARADRGRTLLRDELAKVAEVEQVAVYQNADVEALPENVVERLSGGTVDWITLTSSAITTRLHALLPDAARSRVGNQIRLASISPVTSETVARFGWKVAVEASVHTWEGLVLALVQRVTEGGSAR